MMMVIEKQKINATIMALFIFQFGFLQPLAIAVGSQLPIAGFTFMLLLTMLINNKFRIKGYVLVTLIIISICFFASYYMLSDNNQKILPIYLEFIMKSFSAFLIGNLDYKREYIFEVFTKVALANFFVLLPMPLLGLTDSIGYMRYGYAIVPSILLFIYQIYKDNKINFHWLLLTIISLYIVLIYGSRGPLLVVLLFILLLILNYKGMSIYKKILIATILILFFYTIDKYNLILKLLDYVYFELNIKTYALVKYRMMITQGLVESSSGRDVIYKLIWSYIERKPIFGNGIGFSNVKLGDTSHNIFLQILLESGIIGLLIWIVIWLYCYFKYKRLLNNQNEGSFRVIIIITSLALGRLLVSSDMWLRPEYWFVLSMLINLNRGNLKDALDMKQFDNIKRKNDNKTGA